MSHDSNMNDTMELIRNYLKTNKPVVPDNTSKFYMIAKSYEYYLKPFDINQTFDDDFITSHFNEDFEEINQQIVRLVNDKKRGVVMLHGEPGTGKTNYIKYLAGVVNDRKVVYLPTYMATALADPDFISFVTDNLTGAVIVIEDAEQIITTRESGESDRNAVSTLLNITDGMLGEALNVLVVCTFNTDLSFIDSALLRSGRTRVRYEFSKLNTNKANNLLIKLNKPIANKPMVLADIYNAKVEKTNGPTKQAFGFNAK